MYVAELATSPPELAKDHVPAPALSNRCNILSRHLTLGGGSTTAERNTFLPKKKTSGFEIEGVTGLMLLLIIERPSQQRRDPGLRSVLEFQGTGHPRETTAKRVLLRPNLMTTGTGRGDE